MNWTIAFSSSLSSRTSYGFLDIVSISFDLSLCLHLKKTKKTKICLSFYIFVVFRFAAGAWYGCWRRGGVLFLAAVQQRYCRAKPFPKQQVKRRGVGRGGEGEVGARDEEEVGRGTEERREECVD